ncbi:hypothetical protein ASG40_11570 [Methylobacterium sp. Leaf399]|uniref:hypothetical protein n=1 Tax=Methylobacterium sp. Leaf399 TaxID=1736364 RepID=UPI0006FA736A|nr:hypothetical protein [Methylobacterium sp. Leaf399]KQT08512.1 hypothetical protein ASG40_11570 [Methylobacterium sp. Leaf399]
MSRPDIDFRQPHPATGLLYNGEPSAIGHASQRAAMRALEHDCGHCCEIAAGCFGFDTMSRDGILWSCRDMDCRTSIKARADAIRAIAGGDGPSRAAGVDLFSREVAA